MRRAGWGGVVWATCVLLAAGCDPVGALSSGLKKKPKKKDAGVSLVDSGQPAPDAGADDAGAEDAGAVAEDACGIAADATVMDDAAANGPPVVSAGADVTTDETRPVQLAASAMDPDGDMVAYSWTFQVVPSSAPCGFVGATSGPNVTFRCDDDAIATVTVSVSDGHNPAVSDDVRIEVRNVAGPSQWLRPAEGLVVKRDTPLDAAILIQEPNLADIDECTLFRDDRGDVTKVVRATPTGDPSFQTCVWPASNFLTQLTGMRHVTAHVGERDATVADVGANLVVFAADPREIASGSGMLPVCTTGDAALEFAVHYPTADATRPEGFVRYKDPMVSIDFFTQSIDWFVVSRVRPSTPIDTVALAGKATNGGRECSFLLFARGPKWFEWATGSQFGEARLRLVCGTDVYDTNPSSILDVDDSPMTPFRAPFGGVRIETPDVTPDPTFPFCQDPGNEGKDCQMASMRNVSSAVCQAGRCVLTCQKNGDGWPAGDCDGFVQNGCETDLFSDSAHCAACDHFCANACVQANCLDR